MAGATPVYGFRYQGLLDSPDGPDLGQDLANDVEAKIITVDAAVAALQAGAWSGWTSYTPAFVMDTSNGTKTGWYNRVGKRVEFNAVMVATSGVSLGTGGITVSLPFPAANRAAHIWHGSGMFVTASHTILHVEIQPSASVAEIWAINAANHALATPGALGYGFVAGNRISVQGVYECA